MYNIIVCYELIDIHVETRIVSLRDTVTGLFDVLKVIVSVQEKSILV